MKNTDGTQMTTEQLLAMHERDLAKLRWEFQERERNLVALICQCKLDLFRERAKAAGEKDNE